MNGQDELQEIWNSQPLRGNVKGEEIMELVQTKIRRFDRTIALRNLRECIAAAIVAVFFVWSAFRMPNAVMKTGSIVVATGAVWIVYYLLRHGQAPATTDPNQDVTGYTRALVERYDRQIRLLKSVRYWYLLPMYVGLLILSAGRLLDAKTGSRGWWGLAEPAVVTAVFAGVWWLNEVVAVGRLLKQRARLLSMIGHNELAGSGQ